MGKEKFLSDIQEKNIAFFKENLNELIKNPLYKHKFAIVHDSEVRGLFDTFDTFDKALSDAVSKFPVNEFIIQQVVSDEETINFIYSALATN